MQSESLTYATPVRYEFTGRAPTVTNRARGHKVLTVRNGNVQGDHKTPNPFYFDKRVDECLYNERLVIYKSGQVQQWTGAHRDLNALGAKDPEMLLNHESRAVLHERAMAKIFSQLRGESETFVDAVEGLATLRMLRGSVALVDGVGSLLSYLSKQKHRKIHRGQSALDYMTGKWLEYRYGWMPLVNSVWSAFENIARTVEAKEVEIVARAGARKELEQILRLRSNTFGTFPVVQKDVSRSRIMLVYRFKLVDRSRLWDWTSLNPATIAWELLPFSFVADWFVSVGDSLRALENYALYRSQFLGGYDVYTKANQRSRTINSTIGFTSGDVRTETCKGEWVMIQNQKDRRIVTLLPVPRGPRFRINLNAKKCLDAAALLHVVVGKRSREWERRLSKLPPTN